MRSALTVPFPVWAPQYQEQQLMLDYIGVLATAKNAGRDAYHLNTAEVAQLESLRVNAYDRSSNWISNLLCQGYGICRAPLTGGSEGVAKFLRKPTRSVSTKADPFFRMAPNPANTWVTFDYRLPTAESDSYLLIRDAVSKTVAQLQLTAIVGQLVWDTRTIGPGLYSVQFVLGGKVVQSEKLIVQ